MTLWRRRSRTSFAFPDVCPSRRQSDHNKAVAEPWPEDGSERAVGENVDGENHVGFDVLKSISSIAAIRGVARRNHRENARSRVFYNQPRLRAGTNWPHIAVEANPLAGGPRDYRKRRWRWEMCQPVETHMSNRQRRRACRQNCPAAGRNHCTVFCRFLASRDDRRLSNANSACSVHLEYLLTLDLESHPNQNGAISDSQNANEVVAAIRRDQRGDAAAIGTCEKWILASPIRSLYDNTNIRDCRIRLVDIANDDFESDNRRPPTIGSADNGRGSDSRLLLARTRRGLTEANKNCRGKQ